MKEDMNERSAARPNKEAGARSMGISDTLLSVAGWTRIIAGIPALGLFVASFAISVNALVAVFSTTLYYATNSALDSATDGADVTMLLGLAIRYIEFTDLFLLAVVLYIMALGLVRLFISDKIPTPRWLQFNDFDDLKERLVSVICVMMGVYFLGQVLEGEAGMELLALAGGIAIVTAALTLFVRNVIKSKE